MPKENAYFIVKNLDGKHKLSDIKQKLDIMHGISSVSVNSKNHLVCVDYDSSGTSYDQIENKLNKLGFEIAADASEIQVR